MKRINWLYVLAVTYVTYMPFHVFIAQSASLATGGLEVWKAAKDVVIFLLAPVLLYVALRRQLFQDKTFRMLAILGATYALIHGLYLVFDGTDDTYSTLIACVYNTRLLGFLLLGYMVGSSKKGALYVRALFTVAVIVAVIVAVLGIAQYFLPHDILTHAGYSLDRGVKPMFFIDDKPDLPRIMSTLKDPNSLGSYLILPLITCGLALFQPETNRRLFIRPFRKGILVAFILLLFVALFLTFSRGAVLALGIALVTILSIVLGQRVFYLFKKYGVYLIFGVLLVVAMTLLSKDTYVFQNVIFHADQSTVLADPNELRVDLTKKAVDAVIDEPLGHGPGSAGLIAIRNPKGGILTENYYLQIAYEVGWAGVLIFVIILSLLIKELLNLSVVKKSAHARVLIAALAGYLFYSLLIHLWSNEAIALQWWLLVGVALSSLGSKQRV